MKITSTSGLGGPFLEDFRLVHARLGLKRMACVETEQEVHKRQLFNRPIASIECVHATLEDYLDGHDFEAPAIIWFDYTEPKGITTQIERFARTIGTVARERASSDAQRQSRNLSESRIQRGLR